MKPLVAIVAQGTMGAGLAAILVKHGIEVLTSLEGRSEASRARASAAGMTDVALQRLAEADLLLSIVPPGDALSFAERMAPFIAEAPRKPVFVDCNAVSPATVLRIASVIEATGAAFMDASIIGQAPKRTDDGPRIYCCGEHAGKLAQLAEYGLDVRILHAKTGAASALKMAFAGISKGTIAVASAMILAATRAGAAEALHREMAESESVVLANLAWRVPGSFSKAWRWVAEMQEIAEFAGDDPASKALFEAVSRLFDDIARDVAARGEKTSALAGFFEPR